MPRGKVTDIPDNYILNDTNTLEVIQNIWDTTGINLFYSFRYREFAVVSLLKKYLPNIKWVINGDCDALIEEFQIEIKTCSIKTKPSLSCKGQFQVDKLHEAGKMEYIDSYINMFAFGLFDGPKILPSYVILVNSVYQVNKIKSHFHNEKQKVLQRKALRTRSRDNGSLSFKNLLEFIDTSNLILNSNGNAITLAALRSEFSV
jgi:hypothetical protein